MNNTAELQELVSYLSPSVKKNNLKSKKINWKTLCLTEELSDEFIQQNFKKINWNYFSRYQKLTFEKIDKYINKINWREIIYNPYFDKKFVNRYINHLDWHFCEFFWSKLDPDTLSNFMKNSYEWVSAISRLKLSEDFLTENNKYFNDHLWKMVCGWQVLSEDFIRKFADKVDWHSISSHQEISENFIREFQDKVDWKMISQKKNLSEDFIREFQDKFNWYLLVSCHSPSEEFLREFQNRFHLSHWESISGKKLSIKSLKEFKYKINWDLFSRYIIYNYNEQEIKDLFEEFTGYIKKDYFFFGYVDDRFKNSTIYSEDFIKELKNKVDWRPYLAYNKNYSDEFKKKIRGK